MDLQANTKDYSLRVPEEPFTEVGKIAYHYNQVMASVEDYSQRLNYLNANLEQTVADRTVELEQANQELKRLDRLKDEFLANTSHKLRTPLNSIIGISESLIDGATGVLSKQTRANLAMVANSGRRLFNLVSDILDFSQILNDNLSLRLKPVGLREAVEIVLVLCRPLVGNKDLRLVNAIAGVSPAIEADEDRLQQILYNLVGNAIKFTDRGQVTIKVKRQSLADELIITVADTGIGIAEDRRDRLLNLKQQAVPKLHQYHQILQHNQIIANNSLEHTELLLSGLVIKQDGMLTVKNPIYGAIFNRDWVDRELANLKDNL